MNITNPNTRRYIYGIVAAAIPLLLVAGFITNDQVQPILNAVAAVLGFGTTALAFPNTPAPATPAPATPPAAPPAPPAANV